MSSLLYSRALSRAEESRDPPIKRAIFFAYPILEPSKRNPGTRPGIFLLKSHPS